MPEVHGDRLDVSAEEQRYLRRTFHRFALPWLLVASALGALVGSLPRWIEAQPAASGSGEDSQAREQVGSMRGDVASLSQRLVAAEDSLTKTRDRLAMLEGRSGRGESGGGDTATLEQRLDAIVGRIAALESRVGDGAGHASADPVRLDARLTALDERLARLEGDAHAGAPASRAVAPAANDVE
ncbi:MAG TPA: hypothetical protein VMS55_27055 [Myxococcota bacterium]|nr:hypothetical protein [Myxococcota bacterium]